MKPSAFVVNSRQVLALAPQIKEMLKRYHELNLPIELIHGTADLSVSSEYHTRDFMTEFGNPNFNATYIEGMGHGILQLSQQEIVEALKRLSK
jgi:alpha-beta hydrolase superfamily lysophospholipase